MMVDREGRVRRRVRQGELCHEQPRCTTTSTSTTIYSVQRSGLTIRISRRGASGRNPRQNSSGKDLIVNEEVNDQRWQQQQKSQIFIGDFCKLEGAARWVRA